MSVHAVEVVASSDVDVQNVKNKVADMKTKYGEKVSKQEAQLHQKETTDGTMYYRASFRVDMNDDSEQTKKNDMGDIVEQIGKEAEKSASWCRVRWHECYDESSTAGCGDWQVERENGSVPAEV